MKIIVCAVISRYPYLPGSVWNRIHRILGFQKLGHEVFFVEETGPLGCVDVHGQQCDFERSINRELFQATMQRFGLMDRACQIYNRGEATFGLSLESLVALSKEADLLINMSGHVSTELILNNVKRRVYVDEDPVYTQLWYAEYGEDLNFKMHDIFFSVGLNIGTSYTTIPDCGITWHRILPPVMLEYWPFHIDSSCKRFTTIASWIEFGDLCYRGEWYRSKSEEFKNFARLPGQVRQELEIALQGGRQEDAGIRLLRDNGWILSEASQITDLSRYQAYIARSRAEISIAKNAYVKGCSGWFSDRSSHYLAAGKPVLAQSTGIEHWLPTGRGILTFTSLEEAAAGIEKINQDYAAHCRAAREFAAEYLDYRKVLPQMLELCTA
jgi:Glycosyl transferases group 1